MKKGKLLTLGTSIRSSVLLILSLLVSPVALAQAPEVVTSFAEIERQDSLIKAEAWGLPVWENIDPELVNRIKQRLALNSVVTKYSGMLVYFAYAVDPQSKNPDLRTGPKKDTLVKGYRLFGHHFKNLSKSPLARYEGQQLNSIGINYFRNSQMDSAYYYLTLAENVFKNAAVTNLDYLAVDSSQMLHYLDAYAVILSNKHLPILYTTNPDDNKTSQLERAARMLRLLTKADSINQLTIKLTADSCYARDTKSTIALNTANVYFQFLNDSTLAAPFFRKALQAIIECRQTYKLTVFYNTLSEGYMVHERYDQAKAFAYEGLRHVSANLESTQYGSVVELHGRLAICYGLEKNYDSLRKYAVLVLRDSAQYNYSFNETLILTYLCDLAFKQGRDEDVQTFFPLLKSRMTRKDLFSQESFILRLENERTRAELEQRYERLSTKLQAQTDGDSYLETIIITASMALICFSIAAFFYTRKRNATS